jgi:hypothetical protein
VGVALGHVAALCECSTVRYAQAASGGSSIMLGTCSRIIALTAMATVGLVTARPN